MARVQTKHAKLLSKDRLILWFTGRWSASFCYQPLPVCRALQRSCCATTLTQTLLEARASTLTPVSFALPMFCLHVPCLYDPPVLCWLSGMVFISEPHQHLA